jgi:hypothetical protein
MELNYNTSELVFGRRNELTIRIPGKLDYYYGRVALPMVAIFAGLMLLFTTKHDLIALWVMLIAGSFLAKVKSRDKLFHDIFYPPGLDPTPIPVTLTLTPEGLKEDCGGVTSFAPWNAVVGTDMLDDLLLVNLASNQVALVPRNPVGSPPMNLEEIRDEILRLKEAAVVPVIASEGPGDALS